MAEVEEEIIVAVETGELVVDHIGVGYRDKSYRVVVPWLAMRRNEPARKDGGERLVLELITDVAGRGFLVEQSCYSSDDLYGECPFVVEEGHAVVDGNIQGDISALASVINRRREEYFWSVEQLLGGEAEGAIVDVDYQRGWVEVQRGRSLAFPAFCPITGQPAADVIFLGEAQVPFLVAPEAERWLKRRWWWRYGALVVAFVVYLLLGWWIITPEGFPWMAAAGGLLSFGIVPLVWVMTAERVTTRGHERIGITFSDRDYFENFVVLNSVCPSPIERRKLKTE